MRLEDASGLVGGDASKQAQGLNQAKLRSGFVLMMRQAPSCTASICCGSKPKEWTQPVLTLMPLFLYPGLSPPIHLVNLECVADHREKSISFQLRQVADSGMVEMQDLDTRANSNEQASAASGRLFRHGAPGACVSREAASAWTHCQAARQARSQALELP